MPKGGVLHAHMAAIVSRDFIIKNITFRDNLYICQDETGDLMLKFFDKPNHICDWKLLSDVRKINKTIDEIIYEELSVFTNKAFLSIDKTNSIWKKFLKIFDFTKSLVTYR